jgi:outer membrane protein assembly factor BamB
MIEYQRGGRVAATVVFTFLIIVSSPLSADWLTFGHDPQRSGCAFDENAITTENAGTMALQWAVQLDNAPLSLTSLMPPVVARDVITPEGIKTLVYAAGSSDRLFAVDAASGKVVWSRDFQTYGKAKAEPFYLCSNSINATPSIDRSRNTIYVIASDGRVYGLDLGAGSIKFGPFQLVPPFAKPWSLNFYDGVIYTTTSQGCGGDRSGIYAMNVRDPMHPVIHELLVRRGYGGGMWNRGGTAIGANGRLYVSTGDGKFDPSTGDFGNSFLATSTPNVRLLDYYTPRNWREINRLDLDLPSGGIVWFAHKNRSLIAGSGKQAVVYVLDADSLGGEDHHTPLYTTPRLANDELTFEAKGIWGSPAVWTDVDGETWLYVTVWGPLAERMPKFEVTNGPVPHGSILAFKVMDDPADAIRLEPAWISPDMNLPDPPVIANGVMFALATGENPRQTRVATLKHFKSEQEWKNNLLTNEDRAQGTFPAVLKALDARTGKLLYQSGDAMKSWVHFSGLAVDNGRVYAVDHSSRLYCFGLKEKPQE